MHSQTQFWLIFNAMHTRMCTHFSMLPQSHPEVVEAAKNALDKYGNGLSSVRFICGTQVRQYGGKYIELIKSKNPDYDSLTELILYTCLVVNETV